MVKNANRAFRFALGRELEIAPNTLVSALASQPFFLTYLFLTELLSEILPLFSIYNRCMFVLLTKIIEFIGKRATTEYARS